MAVNAEPAPPQPLLRQEQRARDVAQAQSILRGTEASAATVYALAERLKKVNEFGYARRLFGRIRVEGNYHGLAETASAAKVGQRHALCTYKDPDLPAADRPEPPRFPASARGVRCRRLGDRCD